MEEGFSDYCAISVINMRVEDFLLSFIYELWDIDKAFPVNLRDAFRIGADLKVAYKVSNLLSEEIKESVRKKVIKKEEEGYEYKNVDEMLGRIDELLTIYYDESYTPIRKEIEEYLQLCMDDKSKWYSDELGELYELCEVDKPMKVYEIVDKIICLWKNL